MSERSAMYPFVEQQAQIKVDSQLIDASATPLFEFIANDEWIYLKKTALGVPTAVVGVLNENNEFFLCGEPFFVSGKRRLTIQATYGQFILLRAPRREMLSWSDSAVSGDANSPGQTLIQPISPLALALSASTNWCYLDSNLQWVQAAVGDIGAGAAPFGWQAASSRAGRYYDLTYQFESSVGSLSAYIVHKGAGGTARPTFSIFLGPTGPQGISGIVHIGDEPPTGPIGGLAGGGYSMTNVLGSNAWTIAVTNNVAANLTGSVIVLRRGY